MPSDSPIMGTLLKKPLCADSRVEVVEKGMYIRHLSLIVRVDDVDRAGIKSRESTLYSELKVIQSSKIQLLHLRRDDDG